MYRLNPPAVYAHESVMADPQLRSRVERVVAALAEPRRIVAFSDADIPAMVLEQGLLAGRQAMGTLAEVRDPVLLFQTFRFDGHEAVERRIQALRDAGVDTSPMTLQNLAAGGAFHWWDSNLASDEFKDDKVCRPCWRIHMQQGCVHKCSYCTFGGLLVAMVNVEEYCVHLGRIVDRHPWQQTYLLDDDGDPPCLEPELGTLGPLVEWFATVPDRYLVVHTKTWNTAWMRDLDHRGHTIMLWSLSGRTQAGQIEHVTGSPEQRVEAARLCQEAGYPVRYKFKPIIPVRSWREDAEEVVRLVFERTRPDMISLCTFMWMDVEEMERRLPADLLDPTFLSAARGEKEAMAPTRARPFPDEVRRKIYEFYLREIRRWDADVPVSLSTENFRMWGLMGRELGASAVNYVCGCGPQSTPGARKLSCHPFEVARFDAAGIPGVVGAPE